MSLEIAPGNVLGSVGASGSGKATLLTMLSHDARPAQVDSATRYLDVGLLLPL